MAMTAGQTNTLFTGAQNVLSIYGQYKAAQAQVAAHNAAVRKAVAFAAQVLTTTYNSILNKSYEAKLAVARKETAIRLSVRKAEGDQIALAAAHGATGRRVELARNQVILGGADRALAELNTDAGIAQDALVDRANMEAEAMIQRLHNGSQFQASEFDPIASAISAGTSFLKGELLETQRQEELDALRTSGNPGAGVQTGFSGPPKPARLGGGF